MSQLPFEKIKREILVRKKADTSIKYGSLPDNRSIKELLECGIINVDKPRGPTSHQISDYVKKILKLPKAGHSGTLDPKVTGVLPVSIGGGTKAIQLLLTAGKEYVGIMRFHKDIEPGKIYSVVKGFIGKIMQLPPVKSAVKRQLRERSIYYFDIIEIKGNDLLFRTGTQAGTYIRKLCYDIGGKVGCGAHMVELRRTKVATFNESTLVTLQDVKDAFWYYKNEDNENYLKKIIQPIESIIRHIPKVWIFDSAVESICHGCDLKVPGISKVESGIEKGEFVAILSLKGEFIAYGKANLTSEEMLKDRGLAVLTNKVIMKPGVYPKIEKN